MKNHHHNGSIHPGANSPTQIHEAIAVRAHELWEKNGQPESQSDFFWLEAERQLVAERTAPKSSAGT